MPPKQGTALSREAQQLRTAEDEITLLQHQLKLQSDKYREAKAAEAVMAIKCAALETALRAESAKVKDVSKGIMQEVKVCIWPPCKPHDFLRGASGSVLCHLQRNLPLVSIQWSRSSVCSVTLPVVQTLGVRRSCVKMRMRVCWNMKHKWLR
jgi:hypothetical protein